MLDSDAKIPGVEKIGAYYYNFWKDKSHERGLWRRTTLEEYRKPQPQWETVIDLDALNAAEGRGRELGLARRRLPASPTTTAAWSRCRAAAPTPTSPASSTWPRKPWVKDGFLRPEAKGGLGWKDARHRLRLHRFRPRQHDPSGYPRIVKEWKRGTPMSAATRGLRRQATSDMYIAACHDNTPGFERDFVSRTIAFYNDELYLRGGDGKLVKIDVPNSAGKGVRPRMAGAGTARALGSRRQDLHGRLAAGRELRRFHGRQARLRRAVRADRLHLAGRHHLDHATTSC